LSVKLFALTCGRLTGDLGRLIEGGEGRADLPIPAYLIEHPKGTVLFDTGLHPDCQDDPAARVGARIAGLFSFAFRQGEEISARLEAIDRDPTIGPRRRETRTAAAEMRSQRGRLPRIK